MSSSKIKKNHFSTILCLEMLTKIPMAVKDKTKEEPP